MSRKSKFSAKQKYNIVMEYENTAHSMPEICYKYEISRATLKWWRYKATPKGMKNL